MTQELINKLIIQYNLGIEKIKSISNISFDDAIIYCENYNILHGICYCSLIKFDTGLINNHWIHSHIKSGEVYIYKIPIQSNSVEEIIESLQYRVNIMKTFKE